MGSALLIIDIQNEYFPGGKYELAAPAAAADKASKLLKEFRQRKLPVFHVQHIEKSEDAPIFAPGSTGIQINAAVAPLPGEKVIVKHAPNSFLGTDLKQALDSAKVDHLTVCGMMTHMCVDSTVRAAKELGYDVTLAEDACTTRDLSYNGSTVPTSEVQHAFIAALDGTFAGVTTTEELIKHL